MIFSDLETAIIARLEAQLATLSPVPRVFPAADLANVRDKSQSAASVFVAYNGIIEVDDQANAPHVAKLTTEFIIWIVSRSASRHGSQQGTREAADPLVEAVIAALMGWRPSPQVERLRLGQAPGEVYADGFGYFPLTFTCRRQVRGTIN